MALECSYFSTMYLLVSDFMYIAALTLPTVDETTPTPTRSRHSAESDLVRYATCGATHITQLFYGLILNPPSPSLGALSPLSGVDNDILLFRDDQSIHDKNFQQ